MMFWLQIGSAVTGLVAAALWFCSASFKSPPALFDGGANRQRYDANVGQFNKWAAAFTAVSVLLSAAASLLAAWGGP